MPLYTFICPKCKKTFDHNCSIKEYSGKAKHEECGTISEQREYQNIGVMVDIGPRTVGSLAEKNMKGKSEDELDALWRKQNDYRLEGIDKLTKKRQK